MKRTQYAPQDRPIALYARAFGALFEERDARECPLFVIEGQAAVIDIRGPLVQHPGSYWLDYETVAAAVASAAQSEARAVVLRVDSPGGDALGMGECAQELRKICRAANKPLIGFVDGIACSAAFALMSPCDVIVTPPAGLLGSVGIYQALIDQTAADAQMGLRYEFISSGEAKLDGNPHIPANDGSRARTQLRVDGLADLFFALVAEMRPGVTVESMRKLEGGVFLGSAAIKAGLADKLGSWTEVLDMVSNTEVIGKDVAAKASTGVATMAEEEKMDDKASRKAGARKAFFAAMEKSWEAAFGDEEEEPKKEEPAKEDKAASANEAGEDKELPAPKKEEDKAAATFSLAARLHALETERANEKESHARAALLAKRPDFSKEVLATLVNAPLAMVKTAVETWPKSEYNPAAAAMVTGTAGATTGGQATVAPASVTDHIREKMGLKAVSQPAIERANGGFSSVFNPISQEQAAARLVEMEKASKAVS